MDNDGDSTDVANLLRQKAMVLVSPGNGFHLRGPDGEASENMEGWVRITFAVPQNVLIDGLDRIGRTLRL